MDQLMQARKRVQVAAILALGLFSAGHLNAQNEGTTTNIPGALPNIHLVAPVADGQWTMPAGPIATGLSAPGPGSTGSPDSLCPRG